MDTWQEKIRGSPMSHVPCPMQAGSRVGFGVGGEGKKGAINIGFNVTSLDNAMQGSIAVRITCDLIRYLLSL
jgi:hypothetical protein